MKFEYKKEEQSVRLWRSDRIAHYFNQIPEEDTDEVQVSCDLLATALVGLSTTGVEYESVIELVTKIWPMAEKFSNQLEEQNT